jgi:phosphoglycerate dehydrogenase-like enzyme
VVVLCARFAPGAPPLLDRSVLRAARPGLIVVNVARGGLVDEAALLAALDDGRVGAASLDVFATEPPAPDDPLVHHPRVLALPHVAGVTEDMFRRAGPQLAAELERWRSGRSEAPPAARRRAVGARADFERCRGVPMSHATLFDLSRWQWALSRRTPS